MRVAKSGTLRRCCGRGSKTEKSMTDSTLMVRMAAFWTQSERRKEGQRAMESRGAVVCQKHTTREKEKGRTAGRGEARRALPATLPQR